MNAWFNGVPRASRTSPRWLYRLRASCMLESSICVGTLCTLVEMLLQAAVLLDDGATDRQTQASATLFARIGAIDLRETLENGFELVCRDATTLVAHPNHQLASRAFGVEPHGATFFGRELDRVGKQVD